MRESPRNVKRFEKLSTYELVNFDDLDPEEQTAVLAARQQQRLSTEETYKVGACAISEDGKMAAVWNRVPGPDGHAEQFALRELYPQIPRGVEKKLKLLAIAGARPGEEVVRKSTPYDANVALEQIEWMRPCAKCLEYLHDRTANVEDVEILSLAATGQVIRTSLRSLLPTPHTSKSVRLEYSGQSANPGIDKNGK
jgi:cytidine deaminase